MTISIILMSIYAAVRLLLMINSITMDIILNICTIILLTITIVYYCCYYQELLLVPL